MSLSIPQGRNQDFPKGGGREGVTLFQSEVLTTVTYSRSVVGCVGCLLKKAYKAGGGGGNFTPRPPTSTLVA